MRLRIRLSTLEAHVACTSPIMAPYSSWRVSVWRRDSTAASRIPSAITSPSRRPTSIPTSSDGPSVNPRGSERYNSPALDHPCGWMGFHRSAYYCSPSPTSSNRSQYFASLATPILQSVPRECGEEGRSLSPTLLYSRIFISTRWTANVKTH
jgi:hypothetical protein